MSQGNRVQLGWDAPASKLERFERAVESEWGGTSPYVGIQIEQSWREYRQSEQQNRLEALATDIVEATGRSPDHDEKKILLRTESSKTDKVWNRVHKDVKESMSAYATECDVPNHVVLEGVLDWYLDGGREQSVVDKLDGVIDDIQDTFATVNGDAVEMTKTDRTTIAIANHLHRTFTKEDLAMAINAETSGTNYYHERYTDRVIDYKGVKRLEIDDGSDTFLPESLWKERKIGDIVRNLGGDVHGETPPAFSKPEFADAFNHADIELSEENGDTIDEYRDRLLDRIGFIWNEKTQQFEPEEVNPSDDNLADFSLKPIEKEQSWLHTTEHPAYPQKSTDNSPSPYLTPQLEGTISGKLADHISFSGEQKTTQA
ncbi:hypothetical protein [Halorubellus litoreus]|uniref:Uncharacterized protein n=1 Tax=Halorubellus litoreus TaxID=755308 RepID=A0ABD5VDB2_9EURY